MSVLIKGMEMPTDHPMWIVVHPDGTVEANEVSASRPVGWQTIRNAAVPVPDHGRLIDADAYIAYCGDKWIPLNIDAVNAQPTIIPAEEDNNDRT